LTPGDKTLLFLEYKNRNWKVLLSSRGSDSQILKTTPVISTIVKSKPTFENEADEIGANFVFGELFDEFLERFDLTPSEQIVYLKIYRLSQDMKNLTTGPIGRTLLSKLCNMSASETKNIIRQLEGKGLIEIILDESNDPTKGNKYKILL